jgi:hypothetical protein
MVGSRMLRQRSSQSRGTAAVTATDAAELVDVFACTVCSAVPELVAQGSARLSVIRHAPGCPLLLRQTKTRWPLIAAELPDPPAQVPFARRAQQAPRVRREQFPA